MLQFIRETRGGNLNDPAFGARMKGAGTRAEQIRRMFEVARRKSGIDDRDDVELSTASFRRPATDQLQLL